VARFCDAHVATEFIEQFTLDSRHAILGASGGDFHQSQAASQMDIGVFRVKNVQPIQVEGKEQQRLSDHEATSGAATTVGLNLAGAQVLVPAPVEAEASSVAEMRNGEENVKDGESDWDGPREGESDAKFLERKERQEIAAFAQAVAAWRANPTGPVIVSAGGDFSRPLDVERFAAVPDPSSAREDIAGENAPDTAHVDCADPLNGTLTSDAYEGR
jgi:hypothetical protein